MSINNGTGQVFPYNYEVPVLKANRFTEAGVVERLLQRYGPKMVVRGELVYIFNDFQHTWEPQTTYHCPLLYKFWHNVTQDIINDPRFLNDLCRNSEGEVSLEKQKRMQEKFLNVKLFNTVSRAILNSPFGIRKIHNEDFDNNNDLFFCNNGVLDLVSGEMRDAVPDDLLLNRSATNWNPDVSDPTEWIDFLGEVFEYDEDTGDMIRFMQELFGYTISGNISEQKIFCHYGSGANGKSKILSALKLIGGDYSSYIDPDDFTKISGGFSKAFERFGAKIEGKRIAIVDDLEINSIWNESLVKAVTSPYYRARGEYEKSREVKNRAKLHLGLNIAPAPQAENYGILRRLCLIPYTKQFSPNQKTSKAIDAMIEKNREGILKWSVEGYQRMIGRGDILYPRSSEVAIEEYQENHFILENIIRNMYEVSEEHFQFCFDIHNDVLRMCQKQGFERRVTNEEVGMLVKKVFGIKPMRRRHAEKGVYTGYQLNKLYSDSEMGESL